jgi:hypothetical protein
MSNMLRTNLLNLYPVSGVCFGKMSDSKAAPKNAVSSPPPVTLSQAEKRDAVLSASGNTMSPIDRVEQALKIQSRDKLENPKLTQSRQDFLSRPMGQVNGQPFTGLDLLKMIDGAIQKKWMKRDWALVPLLGVLSVATAGFFFLDHSFRREWVDALKVGITTNELNRLLKALKNDQGEPLGYNTIVDKLIGLGLILDTKEHLRVHLTPLARDILSE